MGYKRKRKREKRKIKKKKSRERKTGRAPVTRKKGISNSIKILSILIVLVVGGIAYWLVSMQSEPETPLQYPQSVTGIFYSNPTYHVDGTGGAIPYNFVSENKLVFFDLKLQNRTADFRFQDRTIPLDLYQDGRYLPLLAISTPSGKLITAIRVCEPCGSFSFHIVQGKYIDCDLCHTKWDIETLTGISGGCTNFPPPEVPSSLDTNNVNVDLTLVGLPVSA